MRTPAPGTFEPLKTLGLVFGEVWESVATDLPHLRRWRKYLARGITSVIHFQSAPVKKLRKLLGTVARFAKSKTKDGLHIAPHGGHLANAGRHQAV